MRRLIDVVLVVVILTGIGFGAYELGRNVDSASNNLAKHDSELNQTVVRHPKPKGPSRHSIELVVVSVTGAAAVMLIVSVGGALVRTRRRERWRAT
ncbi:MAG: hypothetical protein ACXVRJ_02915 [Gaiellaceae bacterium]